MSKLFYILLLIIILFLLKNINAQDYLISFAGTGASNTVDSVKIDNITQCKSKTISGFSTLHLTGTIGIKETGKNVENRIRIYPAPMTDNCSIEFESASTVNATIELYDITGRRIIKEKARLTGGIHTYNISGLSSGVYFLRVNTGTFSNSSIIVCINTRNNHLQINYKGVLAFDKYLSPLSKTSIVNNSGKKSDIIEMQYTAGDRLKFTGFFGGVYRTIFMLIPANSQTITFNFVNCTDADGNHYSVLQAGAQMWMAENLKTTKYNNSENIPNVSSNSAWSILSTGAYCNYKNTVNIDTINTYGRLYNWFTVIDGRNISPAGWHVASDNEWISLINYLGGASYAGGKLKENCSALWQYPNTGATNEIGFTALPGGYRFLNGTFDEMGGWSIWWTSTSSVSGAYNRAVFYDQYVLDGEASDRRDGFAVRCIKD
jgi:uncharacterized protein (TIGR02145 family)